METDDGKNDHAPEWENRILCPDGNCIGVIGPDGRCKECGIPSGNPAERAQTTAETVNTPPCGSTSDAETVNTPPCGSTSDSESDPEWENRKLCPDGNCIGIIGSDGRCRECGRPL
jgi:hypothetical protein